MEKQVLIDDIERNKNEFYKLSTDMKSTGISRGIGTGIYMGLLISQKKIEQLDEQPKVTVPKFVADWIKQCKEKATLADCLKGYYEISILQTVGSEDFQNWVADNENDELTAKAWMFGYEVEKEPKFIVKVGSLYLIEPLGDTYDSTIRTTWNHKNAYKFTIYDMAQTHANKFGGEVEEVK